MTYDGWKEHICEADHILNRAHYEVAAFEIQWQGPSSNEVCDSVDINRLSLQEKQ